MSTLTASTYHSLVAGRPLPGESGAVRATDPATGAETGPEFSLLDVDQLTAATEAAAEAFPMYRSLSPQRRADFLTTAAEKVQIAGDDIIATAMTETGLPQSRLTGELARTVNQL